MAIRLYWQPPTVEWRWRWRRRRQLLWRQERRPLAAAPGRRLTCGCRWRAARRLAAGLRRGHPSVAAAEAALMAPVVPDSASVRRTGAAGLVSRPPPAGLRGWYPPTVAIRVTLADDGVGGSACGAGDAGTDASVFREWPRHPRVACRGTAAGGTVCMAPADGGRESSTGRSGGAASSACRRGGAAEEVPSLMVAWAGTGGRYRPPHEMNAAIPSCRSVASSSPARVAHSDGSGGGAAGHVAGAGTGACSTTIFSWLGTRRPPPGR